MIHRSHRRGAVEYALSAIVLPFRCYDCGTRFLLPRAVGA